MGIIIKGLKSYHYMGLSTDTKPSTNVAVNARFTETDTNKEYRYDGAGWVLLDGSRIESVPPTGKCRVTNIFVDPGTGKLVVQYDDTPV